MSTAITRHTTTALENSSGNFALIDTLRKWGITFFSGVNGGGLIHVAKQQVEVNVPKAERPRTFDQVDADRFVHELPGLINGRRADQVIGLNPRLNNLTTETYL